MPAEDKQQICRWLAEHAVWLFENDGYGEFCFHAAAPRYRDFAELDRLLVNGHCLTVTPYQHGVGQRQGTQHHLSAPNAAARAGQSAGRPWLRWTIRKGLTSPTRPEVSITVSIE